jgi:hypothetical protein
LDFLLKHEESLRKSKSRETLLTCKDLNTKYFHTSTLIRRRANAINFLKSNAGDWFSSRADIGEIFSDHFQNLFSSSNPIIEEEMLDLFSPVISGVIPDITKFAEDVRRISLEHQAAWNSKAQPAQKNWSPPQAGNLTINFATDTNISFSVQAAICKKSTGKIVKALYQ